MKCEQCRWYTAIKPFAGYTGAKKGGVCNRFPPRTEVQPEYVCGEFTKIDGRMKK
jgi:hypothetical protein